MKSEFEKAKTLTDVFKIAKALKAQGKDEVEVNKLASERKRELIKNSTSSEGLLEKKLYVNKNKINMKYTAFAFSPNDMKSNTIKKTPTQIII